MTSAIARNDFAYLDRPFAAQDYSSYRTAVAEESTVTSGNVAKKDEAETSLFGKDGFGFDDFLDIINPLQHIPIISTLYREFTGDELSPGAKMIGGGIFGGGIGLATSVVDSVIQMETGKDVGGHVMAMLKGGEEDQGTVLAATETTPPPSAEGASSPALNAAEGAVQNTALPSTAENANAPLAAAMAALRKEDEAAVRQAATPSAAAPVAAGLEWKNAPPNLQKGLERLQQIPGQNLSEAQLAQILGAFNGAKMVTAPTSKPKDDPASEASVQSQSVGQLPASPIISAPAAARAYENGLNVSDYSYMDRDA